MRARDDWEDADERRGRAPERASRLARWFTPRLRTVFLGASLVIAALPGAALALLGVYESELVRQAEAELFAQAAFIDAAYRTGLGDAVAAARDAGTPVDLLRYKRFGAEGQASSAVVRIALNPALTAGDPLPAIDPRDATLPPDPLAVGIGARLAPILATAEAGTFSSIALMDPKGIVVAGGAALMGQSLAHLQEVRQATNGRAASLLRAAEPSLRSDEARAAGRSGRDVVAVAVPIVHQDRLVALSHLTRPPRLPSQALEARLRDLAMVASLALAAIVVLSAAAALTVTWPVRKLVEQAGRAARGDPAGAEPLAFPGTREIAQLSEAFATMARTLDQRSRTIKDFAFHVSHEFKTPLSAIEGAVELLQDHHGSMAEADRTRFLGNIAADARRLGLLVRRLLELARAEVIVPKGERCQLRAVLTTLAERSRDQGLAVVIQGEADVALPMSQEVCETIFLNLFQNSRQHGAKRVTVSATEEARGRRVRLLVADDGPGIPQEHARRLFTPFFTTRRGAEGKAADAKGGAMGASKSGGTGLGLAIVRALVQGHGGSIGLAPSLAGATFQIDLPTAP